MLEVDRLDFDESEVALPFLRRADLAGDGVAGVKIEAPDLRRRNVDVVGAGKVVVLGGAQEAETVGQAFEDAFREDQPRLFGLRLEDREDQVLLAHPGGVLDAVLLGNLRQFGELHLLEDADVERLGGLGLFATLVLQRTGNTIILGRRLGDGVVVTFFGNLGDHLAGHHDFNRRRWLDLVGNDGGVFDQCGRGLLGFRLARALAGRLFGLVGRQLRHCNHGFVFELSFGHWFRPR